jgi:PAS domain-containing protein
MEDTDRFMSIFNKSPIGILFYNDEGKLIDINPFSFKILGISKSEDISGVNLFEISNLIPKKETLIKKGLVRFQLSLKDFGNCKLEKDINLTNFGKDIIELIISVVDSGFLVMIQDLNAHEKINISNNEEKY